jgi:hypothetical protein
MPCIKDLHSGTRAQTIAWPDYGRNRLHSKYLQTQADHAEVGESGRFGISAYSAPADVPLRRQSLRLRLQGLLRDGALRRAAALGRLRWGCGWSGSASVSLAVGCVPRPTFSRILSRGSKGGRNVFGGTPNTATGTVTLPNTLQTAALEGVSGHIAPGAGVITHPKM